MAQAKTLSKAELKQLLDVTNSCSRYAARDATMLLFTHLCGLRVGAVKWLHFAGHTNSSNLIESIRGVSSHEVKKCNQNLFARVP